MANIKRLSVVALLRDVPEYGLSQGQVGTVGEVLQPGLIEVDFRGRDGTLCVSAVIRSRDVAPLHRERGAELVFAANGRG